MPFDSIHSDTDLYFVTASIVGWHPILQNEAYANIILDAFRTRRKRHTMLLFAYVIMPTHIHAILKPADQTIGQLLQDFGSYTAHKIVAQLVADGKLELLDHFHRFRRNPRSNHPVWQEIQAKNIFSAEFLNQKFEYIHNNPIAKGWELASIPEGYLYSSAGFYQGQNNCVIEINDLREYLMS